jgi:hypothetical protein
MEVSENCDPAITAACAIPTGEAPADPGAKPVRIRAAHRDHNCKGVGPEWYRMRWSGASWEYFSEGRMPPTGVRASDRHSTLYGQAYDGDLIIQHDRGGPVSEAYIVVGRGFQGSSGATAYLKVCQQVAIRRDGNLEITLPNGAVVVRPNPRKS